ncbi:(2Fe-2S)-binding protein [Arthrobacter sp. zg-Y820]|uniref:DUF2231 domain-containing protein n=1 Tax=unclassified Arthrobacter TaxID=235627 RepID=UPI001E4E03DB|nr:MULTISPECIES: DUF2231 domain-containing protein [unclassified Arthrobacter]MCC9197649.1 (2Fe-2S)-binding protein [Arthrobacter sp. zg-Y820]MDK1280516.1 (2Fe-2S)-binding protein [Arthrobacter sp. zg.Y820]WIB10845.1 (2Fe-2S)-binding protein [Arthrobacter sp. zg-Y820]
MTEVSAPQRLARAVAGSSVSERLADVQERLYRPVLDWVKNSAFHTDILGHSIHPPLTDLTLGCWFSASLLDLAGGVEARRSAALLVAAGSAAAVPTAFAGASDWSWMAGEERRIGAVHALGTDAATFLQIGSLIARLRGRHGLGVALSLAGNGIMMGAGFLGGHLALNRGTARRTAAASG